MQEERNYILQMVKKIKASGANVLLIQKSILRDAVTDLSLHYLVRGESGEAAGTGVRGSSCGGSRAAHGMAAAASAFLPLRRRRPVGCCCGEHRVYRHQLQRGLPFTTP